MMISGYIGIQLRIQVSNWFEARSVSIRFISVIRVL